MYKLKNTQMKILLKNRIKFIIVFLIVIIASCNQNNSTNLKEKTVAILPYKGISQLEIDTISKTLQSFYKIKTIQLPFQEISKKAFVNIKSPRFRADSIIKLQQKLKPSSVNYILGLTNKDISVTKKDKQGNIKKPTYKYNDFGVMGLAYCPGKSAIVSTFRLKSSNKKLQLERFKKVVIHEFGHNLGLPHCDNKHCVMTSAAEKITTIDSEKMELCEKCKTKINYEEK